MSYWHEKLYRFRDSIDCRLLQYVSRWRWQAFQVGSSRNYSRLEIGRQRMRLNLLLTSPASRAISVCLAVFVISSPALAVFSEQGIAILGSSIDYESRSASLADIDGDGDLDLFYQGGSNARQLWRNNKVGTGTMTYT